MDNYKLDFCFLVLTFEVWIRKHNFFYKWKDYSSHVSCLSIYIAFFIDQSIKSLLIFGFQKI